MAGVPGRVEIQSRAAGYSIYVVPLLVLNAIVVGVVSGPPGHDPGRARACSPSYGVGLGLVLPVSVRAAYALPDTPTRSRCLPAAAWPRA